MLIKIAGNNAWTLLIMQDTDGWTALHYAAYNNKTKNVKLILDAAGNNAWELLTMRSAGGLTAFYVTKNPEIEEIMQQYMTINNGL